MTLFDSKNDVSGGFLYFNSKIDQNEGFSPYLESNAQTTGDFPGALGIYTKSCKQDNEEKRLWIEKREQRQEVARNLIGGRCEICGRVPIPVDRDGKMIHMPEELRNTQILKNEENFFFGGLMRCGSVWSCPDCASIISEFRRKELKEAFDSALLQGLSISMMTLTVPHYAKDSLENVLKDIQISLRTMKNRKHFKDFAKKVGLVGNIRALEVTYGKNGWHPHFHILLFTEKNIDAELDEFKKYLLSHWQAACVSTGLPCPNEHGLDLVNGTWAASYVSKWGIAEEMTKGHLKNGVKEGHVSPFGLLDLYAEGDKSAGERFKEYAKVFKGRRQLVWSKGLRKMLKVNEHISDEKIIEEVEKKAEVFMTISYKDFKNILKHGKKAEFLSTICPKGEEAVRAWLRELDSLDVTFPTTQ